MQTVLNHKVNNKVLVDNTYETTFVTDTFVICRKLVNDYIEISLTVRDMVNPEFNHAYNLQFFDYPSKFSGWYVCSKLEPYAPNKYNAVLMCIIPLEPESKNE